MTDDTRPRRFGRRSARAGCSGRRLGPSADDHCPLPRQGRRTHDRRQLPPFIDSVESWRRRL